MRIFSKNTPFSEKVAILFIGIGAIIIISSLLISKLNFFVNEVQMGEFGEFIGGFVGSIWSLAGVLLFYSALNTQKEELKSQKDLLVLQINEVIAQTEEFKKQNATLAIQKSEDTFFQLLSFHNEITSHIHIEIKDLNFTDQSQTSMKSITGRRTFIEYYDIYKRFFNTSLENLADSELNDILLQSVVNKSYDLFYKEYQANLGHYFRNLFNILNFIDTLHDDHKKFYRDLLHAILSNYELAMLFFHGLNNKNHKFRVLIEKYSLLSTVPADELIELTTVLYSPVAFGGEGVVNEITQADIDIALAIENSKEGKKQTESIQSEEEIPEDEILARLSKLSKK